jgi:acetyltransferase-like isoleucine patch superfamily enzyme
VILTPTPPPEPLRDDLAVNRINPSQTPPPAAPIASVAQAKPAPKIRNRGYPRGILFAAAVHCRESLMRLRLWYFRRVAKMDIHPDVRISLRANLDFTNPRGVHIGEGTYIAFYAVILAHDMSRLLHTDTYVGKNCFIGAQSIVMPGVHIGDECIVATGAVVNKDVPAHSIVAGNPAQIVRSGIRTVKWGILAEAYAEVTAAERAAPSKPSSG